MNMKKQIVALIAAVSSLTMYSQERPKLVVGIVVDQMKMEYLDRFYNDFGENGFKRMMAKGYVYRNMHFNYAPTYTAPGHASVYTGATPSEHGIMGNDWYNKAIGRSMYCTEDAGVSILGEGSPKEGAMSPKNLLATTMTDELRLSTNFKGKVIGMSIKDRGAILPAGHFANAAYWYSDSGSFISSTFYGASLPAWVQQFNSEKKYMTYINKGWDLLKPVSAYNESLADNNPYEGKFHGHDPVFPYDLKKMFDESGAKIIRKTPYGNDLMLDFAKRAIENEKLGADSDTDFLAISFSSTDYIGHTVGPRAMEIQDTYLRLDQNIAVLIDYLDTKVGKGKYLMFLTADHAAAENSTFLKDNKYNVNSSMWGDLEKLLRKFSTDTYGVDLVTEYSNFNLYFNHTLLKEHKLSAGEVSNMFSEFLMKQPMVKRTYTATEILQRQGDHYLQMIANGFDPAQNGDIVVLWKPGYNEYGTTGTSHGSPFTYDTHVPAIFYGWQIPAGESYRKVEITNIAPTVCQKLKITMPNSTQALLLTEILEKQRSN
jgi:hypothetical protein